MLSHRSRLKLILRAFHFDFGYIATSPITSRSRRILRSFAITVASFLEIRAAILSCHTNLFLPCRITERRIVESWRNNAIRDYASEAIEANCYISFTAGRAGLKLMQTTSSLTRGGSTPNNAQVTPLQISGALSTFKMSGHPSQTKSPLLKTFWRRFCKRRSCIGPRHSVELVHFCQMLLTLYNSVEAAYKSNF